MNLEDKIKENIKNPQELEGFIAFQKGLPLSHNPYIEKKLHDAWDYGWYKYGMILDQYQIIDEYLSPEYRDQQQEIIDFVTKTIRLPEPKQTVEYNYNGHHLTKTVKENNDTNDKTVYIYVNNNTDRDGVDLSRQDAVMNPLPKKEET